MQTLSAKSLIKIGAVALVLGVIFNYLFYAKQIGVSFVIYISLLVGFLFLLLSAFKFEYGKKVFWFLLPIAFFSGAVAVLDNKFLLFWNVVVVYGLFLLLAGQLTGRSIKDYLLSDYVSAAVMLPLNMIGKAFDALGRILKSGPSVKDSQKHSQIFKGILITIPVALFFLVLLASSDLVFGHLISEVFSFHVTIDQDVVAKILWVFAFAFIWFGAYTYILESGESKPGNAAVVSSRRKLSQIEMNILFGTVNVLFLVFVIIQIRYLFAGNGAITQLGFTYAEYAHKGFGELIVVGLATFCLIFATDQFIEKAETGHSGSFKFLSSVMSGLVLVIMASAFLRLAVYEQAYSFTLLRILVQAFIIWLASVFLWLSYKIVLERSDRSFAFGLFVSVLAFFFFFNLANPDALIVRKNISQFLKAGKLDTSYISTLSADSVPELMPLLYDPGLQDRNGHNVAHEVAVALKNFHDSQSDQPWQSYNYSRSRALSLIESKWGLISELSQQSDQASVLQH